MTKPENSSIRRSKVGEQRTNRQTHVSAGSLGRFLWRAPLFLVVSLALLAAALGLLALAGADIGHYFALQKAFLSGYTENWRPPAPMFFAQVATSLAVLVLPLMPGLALRAEFRTLAVAMALLVIFSLLSFFISSKFYNHYLFMVSAPAVVILLSIDFSGLRSRALLLCATMGSGALFLALSVHFYLHDPRRTPDLVSLYAPLAQMAGVEPVMSMHASVVPLYYANLRPFNPLVWLDHAEIIHGPGADGYYQELLNQRPALVITARNWCAEGGKRFDACRRLKESYDEVLAQGSDWPVAGYSLFRRRGGETSLTEQARLPSDHPVGVAAIFH